MSLSTDMREAGHWQPGELRSEPTPVVREMSVLRDTLRTLRRHKLLCVFVFAFVSMLGVAAALLLPPVYSASSSVVIETGDKDVVSLREVAPDVPADDAAVTGELEVLSSRELLEQVATRLGLLENREFNPALHPGGLRVLLAPAESWLRTNFADVLPAPPATEPRPLNEVVETLRRHLVIAPVGRSRVIRITCRAHDPAIAAAIVNTLATLYTENHLRLRDEATREANDWISARLSDLRARADQSAQAVEQYRVAHGLVRGRDSLLIQQQVTEASTQLTAARTRLAEAESTLADAVRAVASGQSARVTSVLNSPLIQQLRQREAELAARRADVASHFGDAHPAAIAAQSQLRSVQSQIDAETNRILQSLREAVQVAQAEQNALAAHLADVRRQVDEASTEDVGLQQLQRVAEVYNALYQTFLTRAKETEPEITFRSVNVRVLSEAVPSNTPVSPNRKLIAVGGLVGGLVAAFGAALARDVFTRGLRTRADVERLIGMAPLGAIPFYRRRGGAISRLRTQEAVASLWSRIAALPSGKPPRSIAITSAIMREGKTTLCRLLAGVAAAQGYRVLVIDADLRCSSLTGTLQSKQSLRGLAELVRGDAVLSDVAVQQDRNLAIVPAGECRESPIGLLASAAFTRVLREAEHAYDVVILDTPPVLIGPDAGLLGRNAQTTLLIARWGMTRRAVVEAALRQLLDVGVRCAGLVLSAVNVSRVGLYDEATTLAASSRARRYYAKLLPRA